MWIMAEIIVNYNPSAKIIRQILKCDGTKMKLSMAGACCGVMLVLFRLYVVYQEHKLLIEMHLYLICCFYLLF